MTLGTQIIVFLDVTPCTLIDTRMSFFRGACCPIFRGSFLQNDIYISAACITYNMTAHSAVHFEKLFLQQMWNNFKRRFLLRKKLTQSEEPLPNRTHTDTETTQNNYMLTWKEKTKYNRALR